jgi:iron complex outermembrane receptor protein
VEAEHEALDSAAPSTVIRRTEMSDAGADLPEVLDQQPGLRTTRLGGLGSFSTLSIRGSTGDQVQVYIDGIPLNSAVGGGVDFSTIPLGPLDRIVVYRGLSPVTFGASAIGGVVSARTRTLSSHVLEIEAGGGSFSTRSGRTFYGYGDGEQGFGLSMDYLGSQGNFHFKNDAGTRFENTDDTEIERTNNAFDRFTGMLKGQVALGRGVALHAVNLFDIQEGGVAGHGLHPTDKASLRSLRNLIGFRLAVDRLGAQTVQLSVVPWFGWSRTELSDPRSEIGLGADESQDDTLAPGIRTSVRVPVPLDDQAAYFLIPTLSAEYRYERFLPGGAQGVSTAATNSQRHRFGAGLGLELALTPLDLELISSIRHESSWSDLLFPANRFDVTRAPISNANQHALTWRAAISQRSIPGTVLTANVSQSVRLPSLFELFGNTGAVLGNPGLEPERSFNLDLGGVFQAPWLSDGEQWTFEVFAFWNQLSNRIQFVRNSQNVSIAANVAQSRIVGIEVGSYLDIWAHLRSRISVSWLQATNQSAVPSYHNKQLPHRPNWKMYGRLEGYGRIAGLGDAEMGGHIELEYISGNYDDFANLIEFPERLILGAGLYLSCCTRQLRFDLSARNLSNSTVQDFIGHPLPGFNVMASMSWTPNLVNDDVESRP